MSEKSIQFDECFPEHLAERKAEFKEAFQQMPDTPSIRERLVRVLTGHDPRSYQPDLSAIEPEPHHYDQVDAILAEQWKIAQEARQYPGPLTDVDLAGFWNVLRHIRDGGR